jgi:hypothetical protein
MWVPVDAGRDLGFASHAVITQAYEGSAPRPRQSSGHDADVRDVDATWGLPPILSMGEMRHGCRCGRSQR